MAHAKRIKAARVGIDRTKLYPLTEAIAMVKARANAKFDETIEVAMNLGVDPRHADQMVRGVCVLPNGSGRTLRVGVFARGAKADEARAAGADVVGAEDLVEIVQGGTINFDRCIATPDMMGLVGPLGRVLGPRGLMPTPKNGTVTSDIATAVPSSRGARSNTAPTRAATSTPWSASSASPPSSSSRTLKRSSITFAMPGRRACGGPSSTRSRSPRR